MQNLSKFIVMQLVLFTLIFPAVYSQNQHVKIQGSDITLKSAFSQIEKQTGLIIGYEETAFNTNAKIKGEVKNTVLKDVLTEILKGTSCSFKFQNTHIFIYPQENNNLKSPPSKKNITGTVVDDKGETIIGASVLIKGTTLGITTDINGNFSIQANPNDVIVVSYIGYNTKEYAASLLGEGSQIVLDETAQRIKEVTIVGYGVQKRASVVGAITSIEPTKLNVSTSRSLSNDLAGNIAGIIGVQRSGEPGYDNSEFWIRGISTFQGAGMTPLVLIDGIERSLNDIDIAEIESFSVLKDASASAVYGVRGANGVILITTKRGYAGKTNINVTVEHSITRPEQLPHFLDAPNYVTLLNNINIQDNGNLLFEQNIVDMYRNGYDRELYPNVNWIDAITNNTANNTRASFDLSGGSEKLRYSFVGAYYNETGITTSDPSHDWSSSIKVNRFNLRTNVDMNITETTLLTFNIGGYLQRRNAPMASIDEVFSRAFTTPPHLIPITYDDGRIPVPLEGRNPWASLTQTGFQREAKSKLESLFAVEQDLKFILQGLKIKGLFSFDYYSLNKVQRQGTPFYYTAANGRDPVTGELKFSEAPSEGKEFLDYGTASEYGSNSTYLEANLSYDRTIDDHYINALFLYNQRDYDDGDQVPYRNQGFAGRASYTYQGKYIAEFNFGYNGSENFARGKRLGFFPSVAAGWIVSEEPFMVNVRNIFDKIKIRASYGLVGNDKFEGRRFAYITTISSTDGYQFGSNSMGFKNYSGWREGDVGVYDLTWETVKKANLGVELGLLSMMELQVDFFHDRRENIFIQRNNYPNSAGFSKLPWANYGVVVNKGLDVQFNVNKQITRDWFLSLRASGTFARNKIIEQDEDILRVGTYRSGTGKPVGQIFGLIAEGVFTEDDFEDLGTGELKADIPKPSFTERVYPGDIKYKNMNDDNVIDSKDETAIGGTVNPELVYGFGLNTSYKNFDFGFFFQGNGRTYRMIGRGNSFLPGAQRGRDGNIYANAATDAWTVDNPRSDTFYPRLHIGYNANNAQPSTWWLKDMGLLRLKNVEFGYSLPKNYVEKLPVTYGRIFARGTNLFHLSKFKLWDSELDTDNGLKYPIMSTYSIGLQLKF
ncbi:MAG: SusC/RagA family protein [Bacteroidales bacterium 36-12]|nr:MAG: SusC/RagA family protein [Bacteroidales bacterium 36-12]